VSLMASQQAISERWPAFRSTKKAMSRMVSSPAHGLSSIAVAQNALYAPFRRAESKTDIHGTSKHIHLSHVARLLSPEKMAQIIHGNRPPSSRIGVYALGSCRGIACLIGAGQPAALSDRLLVLNSARIPSPRRSSFRLPPESWQTARKTVYHARGNVKSPCALRSASVTCRFLTSAGFRSILFLSSP
jgi:hypothetical protein